MRRGGGFAAALLLVGLVGSAAFAVEPNEMLKDPAQEARARALSAGLRCLVCQNESIDDSHADLAHDIRVLLRERIGNGDTDQQAIDFLVARYGDFILLKPRFSPLTLLLWGTPVLVLALGGLSVVLGRRRRGTVETAPLSAEEKAALARLLAEKG